MIELEFVGNSVNSNGNGSNVKGLFHSFRVSLRNITETNVFENRVVSVASSFTGGVRISVFSRESVLFNIFETIIHQASIASIVSIMRAVNQSLFREFFQFTAADGS